jgi:hypothetical protein
LGGAECEAVAEILGVGEIEHVVEAQGTLPGVLLDNPTILSIIPGMKVPRGRK